MDRQRIKSYWQQGRQSLRQGLNQLKPWLTFPNITIAIGLVTAFIYVFSFLFPFTDNAFVMNNVRPVAAQVEGFITRLDVQNGQRVKPGDRLFTVFAKPYVLTVQRLQAELHAAQAQLAALRLTLEKDRKTSEQYARIYTKKRQDDEKFRKAYALKSISLIRLQNSQQETRASRDRWQAAKKQLDIDLQLIHAQEEQIKSIRAQLGIARVNLELTEVRAAESGVVQNLFLSVGTPVKVNQALFSLVNDEATYIQANFNETDLRRVKAGDKVWIFPRMYLGSKMFHGEIISNYWAANRQRVDPRSQLQNVTNENQWILLPQRLPVIIRVTDPHPDYPLRLGASAYVYVRVG